MRKKVLVVEDDPVLTRVLRDNLTFEGFEVESVADGSLAQAVARDFAPDLVLLDVNLPGQSGFDLCAAWRQRSQVPIILLTAMGQKSDKVRGLQLGADDYVTKPFGVGELLARIKAIFRRLSRPQASKEPETIHIGTAEINLHTHTLCRARKTYTLTFYEVELLKLLYERVGQPVSRDEILDKIWGIEAYPSNRTVDNFVVKLRKKLEDNQHHPRHILTVYGFGYKLAL